MHKMTNNKEKHTMAAQNTQKISNVETLASYMLVPQVMLHELKLDAESHDAYHFKLGSMLVSIPKADFKAYA